MQSYYDKIQSKYIKYLEAYDFYDWAMSQNLIYMKVIKTN